jgi:hypothetical protein
LDLTPLKLTPLGLVHTILSVITIVAAIVAIVRDREITPRTGAGRFYLWTLVLTCLTGLPIFRKGGIQPPHILGVLILVTIAIAMLAGRKRAFGGYSTYVETIGYSATVFFLSISTVTETLTRLPPASPILANPDAPAFKPLYLGLIILFIAAAVWQWRKLRASAVA